MEANKHWFHAHLQDYFTKGGRQVFWDAKGECLMSGLDTLDPSKNNHTMILGLNPGGDRLPALAEQVRQFFKDCSGPWSCYVDQCWHPSDTDPTRGCGPRDRCGECSQPEGIKYKPHQSRVRALAEFLNIDLHRTLTLNAIFYSSRNAVAIKDLKGLPAELASPRAVFKEVFFPIVQQLIQTAKIRHVICLGNGQSASSFSLMASAFGVTDETIWSRKSPEVRFFKSDGVEVAGVPHPSWPTKLTEKGANELKAWYPPATSKADSASGEP